MANPEHIAELEKGRWSWNAWRSKNPLLRPDLSQADLSGLSLDQTNLSKTDLNRARLINSSLTGADISDADLFGADLIRADLRTANLYSVRLFRADLTGADLSNAFLARANFTETNLDSANLSGAALNAASFIWAGLNGTDFSGATTDSTSFVNLDLRNVKGLETIRHLGPSSIGMDTIYRSVGKIPHSFLRGAGVPENFVQYMTSLVGTGIEFYSLFISYSTKDQEFADRLHGDLQDKGVRCWFAPHDVSGGKKLHEQIDEAIRAHDKLLLILSPSSMQSEWVKTEIAKARKRETKENKRVLFPILLCKFEELRDWECFDADTGKDSAREIREYFISDFSDWKDHDSYKKAFDRLLKDLQGKPDPASA